LKKALALSALPLVLLFAAAFQSPNSILEQLKVIQSQNSSLQSEISDLKAQVASTVPRKYYMTRDRYDGAHALTACAAGYHMASLWEIHETSNLRYDTELGLTRGDSGCGPPNSFSGWSGTFAGLQSNWSPPRCNHQPVVCRSAQLQHRGKRLVRAGLKRKRPPRA
jgi:hypothetical protein